MGYVDIPASGMMVTVPPGTASLTWHISGYGGPWREIRPSIGDDSPEAGLAVSSWSWRRSRLGLLGHHDGRRDYLGQATDKARFKRILDAFRKLRRVDLDRLSRRLARPRNQRRRFGGNGGVSRGWPWPRLATRSASRAARTSLTKMKPAASRRATAPPCLTVPTRIEHGEVIVSGYTVCTGVAPDCTRSYSHCLLVQAIYLFWP